MATIYDKNAAYMALPMNIKRGNPIPLDTTAVWDNKAELEAYAKSGATSYVGQILTLFADGVAEAYLISNEAGDLVKLAQTSGTGDVSADIANLNKKINSLVTEIGKASTETESASGLYALIEAAKKQADKGVADAKAADDKAQSAQNDLDALEAVVGADDTAGLRKRIKANEDAIGVLNGTGEGSVDKAVKDAIDDFASKVTDDGTINTFKELVDWVAKHPEVAQGLTTEINALKTILAGFGTAEGETATVKKYVDDAIAALKIGDYAKVADLTALAERVSTLEGKPAASITQEQIDAWTAKQDTGDFVEKSAYNTKVKALEDADAANATAIAGVKTTAEAAVKAVNDLKGTATKTVGAIQEELEALDETVNNATTGTAARLTKVEKSLADEGTIGKRIVALEGAKHTHDNKEVLDGITAEKVSAWDAAQVNVIEKVQVNGTDLAISDKTVNIPLATAQRAGLIISSDAKDSISISSTGIGVVNSLNVNKLYQDTGDELVLDGGNATTI